MSICFSLYTGQAGWQKKGNMMKKHPSWGAPKIRDKLIRAYPMIKPPAISTIHAVLDRNGLVKRRKRRRYKAEGTTLVGARDLNGLWCADYKGEFMLGNKQYCYPLTITDYRSRYLLTCEGVTSTSTDFAFSIFERAFKDFGLPDAIRTDNGVPFASGNALFGLSKLSVCSEMVFSFIVQTLLGPTIVN